MQQIFYRRNTYKNQYIFRFTQNAKNHQTAFNIILREDLMYNFTHLTLYMLLLSF